MQSQPKWANNKTLLVQLAQNFKMLQEQNKKLHKLLQTKTLMPPVQSSSTITKPQNQMNRKKQSNQKQKQKYSKDQQKILKLYSYKTWEQFMGWIDQKLQESGQTIQINDEQNNQDKEGSQIKRVLSEILQQPDFQQSYTIERPEQKNDKFLNNLQAETQLELMAIQNGKLRRQNIQLKSKLTEIRALYLKSLQN